MNIPADLIKEAKSKLGDEAALIIADDLNIEEFDRVKLKGKSIFKQEKTPSMIWYGEKENGSFMFKCFSTGKTYDIINHFMSHYNLSFSLAVKKLLDLVSMEYTEDMFKSTEKNNFYSNYNFPADEKENDRKIVEEYMARRGITKNVLTYCNIKQSSSGDIAFQLKDINGVHVATKYRVARGANNGDYKWYWQSISDNCPVLYGIDKVDITKPLVICEGMVDYPSLVQAGVYNSVSINGGAQDLKWIDFNWEVLEKIPTIILFFDDDVSGQDAVKKIIPRIGEAKAKIVRPTPEIKEQIRKYYKENFSIDVDKVDANNVLLACGESTLSKLVQDADFVPNRKLRKLTDYDASELQDLTFNSTGFKKIDEVIYGTLPHTLTLLSGKTGNGKSTFINQAGIIAAIENGDKVMIFSGEANPNTLLGDLLRPLASERHIMVYHNEGRPDGYKVTSEATRCIKEFYKDQIFIYDDVSEDIVSDADDLLLQIEYAFKRYGVTNFVIDNLMCLSIKGGSDDDNDKYENQTAFIIRLKRFTRVYPVSIFLVAHPKKPAGGATGSQDLDIYSIAGSSTLGNIADRGMAITILDEDKSGYNNKITIIKDRQSGRTGKNISQYYDVVTKRIYSDEEERVKKYKWEIELGDKIRYSDEVKKRLACNVNKLGG